MRVTFYVERVPGEPLKGRGWIDIRDFEIVQRLNIPLKGDSTNSQIRVKIDKSEPEYKMYNRQEYFHSKLKGISVAKIEDKLGFMVVIVSCHRGKAGGKKFEVIDPRENVPLIVQKSLTIESVRSWVKTWADKEAQLVTPGGKKISVEENKIFTTEYVYLIYSQASNTVKIGRAKNVEKRLKTLQTAHPYPLKILKTFQANQGKGAKALEKSLHRQFASLRLSGEWFQADETLLEFAKEPNFLSSLDKDKNGF